MKKILLSFLMWLNLIVICGAEPEHKYIISPDIVEITERGLFLNFRGLGMIPISAIHHGPVEKVHLLI